MSLKIKHALILFMVLLLMSCGNVVEIYHIKKAEELCKKHKGTMRIKTRRTIPHFAICIDGKSFKLEK